MTGCWGGGGGGGGWVEGGECEVEGVGQAAIWGGRLQKQARALIQDTDLERGSLRLNSSRLAPASTCLPGFSKAKVGPPVHPNRPPHTGWLQKTQRAGVRFHVSRGLSCRNE